MISQRHQFIFVHIPKTAGNALQSILAHYSEDTIVLPGKDGTHRFGVQSAHGTGKHATLADYLAALGPQAFWSKTRFTCVRNPWDRAISFYFSPHSNRRLWDRGEFIRILDHIPAMITYLRLPNEFSETPPYSQIDFLLRFEHLQQDFDRLCEMIGIPKQSIPRRNASNRLAACHYYDKELVQIVGARFFEDIAHFDYSFGELAEEAK